MDLSKTKLTAIALSLAGAAAFATGASAQQVFTASESGYITKNAGFTYTSTGGNQNLIDNSTSQNWDYDIYNFSTTALTASPETGTVTSASLTLYNDSAGKYGSNGSVGSNPGILDFYLGSPVVNLKSSGTGSTEIWAPVTTDSADGTTVLSASPFSTASGGLTNGYGEGVQSTLENTQGTSQATGTPIPESFITLGQFQLTSADLTASSFNVNFNNLSSADVTYLDGLTAKNVHGLDLLIADDSTQAGAGAADSFYGANTGSTTPNATFSISESSAAPAPENSSYLSEAGALAVLGGLMFFGLKRRQLSQ